MEEYVHVFTTVGERENAERIARVLVEARLVACVQVVGPIESTYWWKGKIEKATEWLCLIKTRKELFGEVEKAIKELHPYETPEIIALPITVGSKEYLEWIGEVTKRDGCPSCDDVKETGQA